MERGNPCVVLVGMYIAAATVINSVEVPQKLKIVPYHPAILFLDISPKEVKALSRRDTYIPKFITALFTIPKTWKQPECPLMDE